MTLKKNFSINCCQNLLALIRMLRTLHPLPQVLIQVRHLGNAATECLHAWKILPTQNVQLCFLGWHCSLWWLFPLLFILSDFILWFYIKTSTYFCPHQLPLTGNQHPGQVVSCSIKKHTGRCFTLTDIVNISDRSHSYSLLIMFWDFPGGPMV